MQLRSIVLFCFLSFAFNGTSAEERPGPPATGSTAITKNQAPSPEAISRLRGKILRTTFKDILPRTRGPKDVLLYKIAAPSVVLIYAITNDGQSICSGSLLGGNIILTAAHCVEDDKSQTIVWGGLIAFKPLNANGKVRREDIIEAEVIKVDLKRDLAIMRLRAQPPPLHLPLEVSTQDSIDVGTDVFAIGHPKGEDWTFTKGIVSQFRPDYLFGGNANFEKRATVIQTQTPINVGNSGGPLLSEDGKIVGVISFSHGDAKSKSENMNYAIAAKEIRNFLGNSQ